MYFTSLPSTTAVIGMLKADALRIIRDRFLLGVSVYILFVFIVMRWAIPWVTVEVANTWAFDLAPYHPLIVSHLVVQLAPMVPGIVGAFLLLESREEGTVKALLVAPTPLTTYVAVGTVVMCGTAALLTLISSALIGLRLPVWTALFAVSVAGAPAASIFALLVAAVSSNKVQAFAYMKLFGSAPLIVIVAFFVPEPWQWLNAVYPPYCASKAYWVAEAGGNSWPLWIFAGLVTSAVWLGVLLRFYMRVSRR